MGRQCFCGCGRSIPIHRVGLRVYNTRGSRILERLQSVRELASGEGHDPYVARWCAKGDVLVTQIAEVVHRERDPWSVDDAEIRIWLADGRLLERRRGAGTTQSERPPEAIGH